MSNNFLKLSDIANHPSLRLSQRRGVAAVIPQIHAMIKGEAYEDRLYAIHPPASGKSFIPLLVLAILRILGIPARICYVASSEALVTQFCADALKPFVKDIIGFNPQIHASTNEINPSRGLDGYATTYQGLAADRSGINKHEFTNHPYLTVHDEGHHIYLGGVFHSAIQPLEEKSIFNISMTGTDERSDGRPIANFPYVDIGNGLSRLDYSGKCYSRTTLSEEKSQGNIIDTSIHAYDARCEYSEDGIQIFEESLASIQDKTRCRKAIRTAIRTDTRDFIRSSGLRMFD